MVRILLILLLLTLPAYAGTPAMEVALEPAEEISFNTVEVGTSFVTCSTGLLNRREINIFNTSDSEIVFV